MEDERPGQGILNSSVVLNRFRDTIGIFIKTPVRRNRIGKTSRIHSSVDIAKRWHVRIATLLVIFSAFQLPDNIAAAENRLKDEGELSFISTSGNTEVKTLSLANTLTYAFSDGVRGKWKAGLLYGEENGSRTAEEYTTELRLDYDFTVRVFSYVSSGYKKNELAGIRDTYLLGPGVGLRLLEGPRHVLTGEAGIMYRDERYVDGTEDEFLSGRVFVSYELHFHEKTRFNQTIEYLPNLEGGGTYYLNSETAFISALNNRLSLKAGYLVNYNSTPAVATKESTDTRISLAILLNM